MPVLTVGEIWNALWDNLPGPASELHIDQALPDSFIPLTHADSGMCGGMVYTIMDYYNAHLRPAEMTLPPNSRDDPLFRYIKDRLLASFDVTGGGWRWLAYSAPLYPNGDEGFGQAIGLFKGRSWIAYREEWPRIQDDIDAGRLSPLGLIQSVTLYIYDPNEGQHVVNLTMDVTSTSGEVHVHRFVEGQPADDERIWGFFRIDGYQPRMPPGGSPFRSLRAGIRAATQQTGNLSASAALAGSGGDFQRGYLDDIANPPEHPDARTGGQDERSG